MDEKLFAILVMVIGAGIFGYGVSNIVNIVGDLSIRERHFRQKMDRVNAYLQEKDVPELLKGEIREFFHLKRRSKHSTIGDEIEVLDDLSAQLRSKVALAVNEQVPPPPSFRIPHSSPFIHNTSTSLFLLGNWNHSPYDPPYDPPPLLRPTAVSSQDAFFHG
jgi:hypothetical protein